MPLRLTMMWSSTAMSSGAAVAMIAFVEMPRLVGPAGRITPATVPCVYTLSDISQIHRC